jgi:hypothetical protein
MECNAGGRSRDKSRRSTNYSFTLQTFVAIFGVHPRPPSMMPELLPYLEAAAAHPDLKREVLEYLQGGSTSRLALKGYAPRVKVERVLTQLFHAHPDLRIEHIELSARSGCSDFVGEIVAKEGDVTHRFAFTWCCAWRARELGWKDCFGFWDQMRAAREYGWRCFERWEGLPA